MNKPPAFQFYADDFIAGTADLSQEEVGSYIRLLCYQWSRGCIPVEAERQQRLAGGSVSVEVISKFKLIDGCLKNERLELERDKQSRYREKQRLKGVLSAEKRQRFNHGSTTVEIRLQPEGSSPSPSPNVMSSGQATTPEIPEVEVPPEIPKTPRAKFVPPTIEQVAEYIEARGEDPNEAQNFFDYYESNGWRVGKNQMKSWGSALSRWLRTAKGFSNNGRNGSGSSKVYGETTEEKHRRLLAEAMR